MKNSNFNKVFDRLSLELNSLGFEDQLIKIKEVVKKYSSDRNMNIRFLNFCPGFQGLRTKDQIIICSPNNMSTLGDFLYVIFHEIRHEVQVRDIKMGNPFINFDINDFESIYNQYWEMELDADQFAKNVIAKLIIKSEIPIDIAKRYFTLSPYIQNYPAYSSMIRNQLKLIINEIKSMDYEFEDIQDLPRIKMLIDKLEDFF